MTARMTKWSPSTEREHDDVLPGLCQYASHDNLICWEVATETWYKSLGVKHVCQEHYVELAKARESRLSGMGRRFVSLSDRWGD